MTTVHRGEWAPSCTAPNSKWYPTTGLPDHWTQPYNRGLYNYSLVKEAFPQFQLLIIVSKVEYSLTPGNTDGMKMFKTRLRNWQLVFVQWFVVKRGICAIPTFGYSLRSQKIRGTWQHWGAGNISKICLVLSTGGYSIAGPPRQGEVKLIFTVGEAVRSTCGNQARARAKPERAAGLSMRWRVLPPIFSEVSAPIWFTIVGK